MTYTYPPGRIDLIIAGYTSATPIGSNGIVTDFYLARNSIRLRSRPDITAIRFTRFATTFDHSTNNGHTFVEFRKLGSLPAKMNVPEPASFPVTNKDPFNEAISTPSNALF